MSNASNLSTLANVLDDGSDGQFLKSTGSGGVAFDTVAAGAVVYATADLLPLSGFAAGDMAYVTATNRFYINNGSGWYSISLVNTNPNITSVADASSGTTPFTLATDQTATVITITAADPEEVPLTYGYSVTSGSLNGSTVAQGTGSNTNVFTVTPHASQDATFTITFTASDGINQATSANAFSLSFVTIVADSNHTTLLATATGTSDNNNITDSSTANSGNPHNITVNGDTYAGSFSPYRSGGYSTFFGRTRLNNPSGDPTEAITATLGSQIGTGDFSFSYWVYVEDPSTGPHPKRHFDLGGSGVRLYQHSNANIRLQIGGSTVLDYAALGALSIKSWHYVSVTRSSGTVAVHFDGILAGSTTNSTDITQTNFRVGAGTTNDITFGLIGYVRDFMVKNVAVYSVTENYTVPNSAAESDSDTLILLCSLPYHADGSSNDLTLDLYPVHNNVAMTVAPEIHTFSPYDYLEYDSTDHGGSVYFDGSNDDLTITDHSAFDLSTGNWTVEFWWNPKSVNTNEGPMSVGYGSGSTPTGLKFAWENSKLYAFSMNGSTLQTGLYHDATAANLVNKWNHVAAVYNGTNTDLYLNGVASGRAQSTNFGENSSDDVRIGSVRRLSSIHYSECSISDVRIVKGTAVYSGNFTPPTGPLTTTGGTYASTTNVNTSFTASNTSLLIKGTDASIIDKSQGSNLKLIGSTTGSTDQVRTGNWANTKTMKFDRAVGDYITIPNDDSIFSKDYTIEFWMYPTQDTNLAMPFSKGVGLQVYHQSGNIAVAMSASNSGSYFYNGNFGSITTNAWSHISLVRDSSANTYKFYINGTLEDTLNSSSNIDAGSADWIIAAYSTTGGYYFAGYIQDLRVTEGLARYTATDETSNIPSAPLEG